MKNVFKTFGLLTLSLGICFFIKANTPQVAYGYFSGGTITCYSTFLNASVGGKSTVDCADCKRVNNTKDREDRGSCTPGGDIIQ